MKARLIKRGEMFQLLFINGQIKIVSLLDIKKFFETFDDDAHYKGNTKWNHDIPMKEFAGETLAIVNKAGHLIIYDAAFYREVLSEKKITYLTANEYAEKCGKQSPIIRRLCKQGRFPGAVYKGKTWLIPEDAEYPADARYGKRI